MAASAFIRWQHYASNFIRHSNPRNDIVHVEHDQPPCLIENVDARLAREFLDSTRFNLPSPERGVTETDGK